MKILAELRRQRHLSQDDVAKFVGYSKSSVAMWETGQREPSNATILKLSEYFGVTSDYLLTGNPPPDENGRPGPNWVPVKGVVRAGIPIDAIEDIIDWEELTPEMARSATHIGLRVVGDSMEPRFREGDTVIIRVQPDLESGEIGVVIVNGDTATVKKVIKRDDGIMLVALNPNYEPKFYTNKEITTLPVRVLGKVVELRAKF